jgi:hypothetical protein
MGIKEFQNECRGKWVEAIAAAVGPVPPTTSVWHGPQEIVSALAPFANAMNHMLLPAKGGGTDIHRVALGVEPGTIELLVGDGLVYVAKAAAMTLEYLSAGPAQSFIIIDLATLAPSGTYPLDGNRDRDSWYEEVVRLPSGDYVERGVLDAGYIGHDRSGREIPVPNNRKLVIRIFRGRLMLVTKGSMWNRTPAAYNGPHDRMTNQEIRDVIEGWISSADTTG